MVLCNASTGECQELSLEEVPQWVDRVYPAELLIRQYNWSGAYKNGWFNSWLGQSGVVQTTPGSNGQLGYNYIAKDDEAHQALNQIRLITMMPTGGKFRYDRIPELNDLMAKVKASHGKMLDAKRDELLEIVRQCMEEIHTLAGDNGAARNISNTADNYFTQKKQQIASYQTLALLDGLVPPIWQYKDETVSRIESVINPPEPPVTPPRRRDDDPPVVPAKEVIKAIHRQAMFPAKTLKSEEEIDAYVEKIRTNMKQLLKGCDGIKLN